MSQEIKAIFLDVGNTLRVLLKDEPHRAEARKQIATMVGTKESPEVFCERLDTRYQSYRKWAFETLIEAAEAELWTRWLLPDYPTDKIKALAAELTYQYRQSNGRRVLQEDAKNVISELNKRGYILGLVSNVITAEEIPAWLEEDGLACYFKSVVLSSVFGRRKPHPAIFKEALRLAEVDAAQSVYVGDNPSRDIVGPRNTGFGMVVILYDEKKPIPEDNPPDLIIHKLCELLNYFPPL